MGQNKLKRFADIATFPNVLQYPQGMAGKWSAHFGNENPLVLELACGKGEYAVGLGRLNPRANHIGIDIKGNRIWVGARQALAEGLHNVAFIRSQIDKLTDYFAAGEVDEVWITFPDPQLRASRAKKRLTHPAFLRRYRKIIKPNGLIHLKTDSPDLYDFTRKVVELYGLETVRDIPDVQAEAAPPEALGIKTHYEGLDISGSHRIHYLCFRLTDGIEEDHDLLLKQWVTQEPIKARSHSNK